MKQVNPAYQQHQARRSLRLQGLQPAFAGDRNVHRKKASLSHGILGTPPCFQRNGSSNQLLLWHAPAQGQSMPSPPVDPNGRPYGWTKPAEPSISSESFFQMAWQQGIKSDGGVSDPSLGKGSQKKNHSGKKAASKGGSVSCKPTQHAGKSKTAAQEKSHAQRTLKYQGLKQSSRGEQSNVLKRHGKAQAQESDKILDEPAGNIVNRQNEAHESVESDELEEGEIGGEFLGQDVGPAIGTAEQPEQNDATEKELVVWIEGQEDSLNVFPAPQEPEYGSNIDIAEVHTCTKEPQIGGFPRLFLQEAKSGSVNTDKHSSNEDHDQQKDKVDRHLADKRSYNYDKRINECIKLLNNVTVKEAQRSFISVCKKLQKALKILHELYENADIQDKAHSDKFSKAVYKMFSGIQATYAVRSTALGKEQDRNVDFFPRLLELARTSKAIFSSKQYGELESMMRSMRIYMKVDECSSNHDMSKEHTPRETSEEQLCDINVPRQNNDVIIDIPNTADKPNGGFGEITYTRSKNKLTNNATNSGGAELPNTTLPSDHSDASESSPDCVAEHLETVPESCLEEGVQDHLTAASSYCEKFLSAPTRLPSPTPAEDEDFKGISQVDTTLCNIHKEIQQDSVGSHSLQCRPPSPTSELVQVHSQISLCTSEVQSDGVTNLKSPAETVVEDHKLLGCTGGVNLDLKSRDPRKRLRDGGQFQAGSSRGTCNENLQLTSLEGRKHERDEELFGVSIKRQCLHSDQHGRLALEEEPQSSYLISKQSGTEAIESTESSIGRGLVSVDVNKMDSSEVPDSVSILKHKRALYDVLYAGETIQSTKRTQTETKSTMVESSEVVSDVSCLQLNTKDQSHDDALSKPPSDFSNGGRTSKPKMKLRDPRRALLESSQLGITRTCNLLEVSNSSEPFSVTSSKKSEARDIPSEAGNGASPRVILKERNAIEGSLLECILEDERKTCLLPPDSGGSHEVDNAGVDGCKASANADDVVATEGVAKPLARRNKIFKSHLTKLSDGLKCWEDLELIEGLDEKQREAVYLERARRIDEQNMMLNSRKLCLVLDLDHTLLNSAKFSEVNEEWAAVLTATEAAERSRVAMEGKHKRELYRFPHMGMWTKLRPGVWNFLSKASQLYELHVYTMGNRVYATEMARLLDPTGNLFAGRVISKGDDGDGMDDERPPKSKDLDGVLGMESAVLIIDDSMRVWPHHRHNLILVERYMYFPSSRRQFGLPGPSLLEIRHDEREVDGMLASVLEVIEKIHHTFFSNQRVHEGDVRSILASEKQKVLAGCKIVFSRIYPQGEAQPHLHPLWQTAEQFGAVCSTNIDQEVTHVVAISRGTDKVKWALANGKFSVSPAWLEASAVLYRRANEYDYPVPP